MAEYVHPESLVSTDWVAEHGNDANVRLVEVDVDMLPLVQEQLRELQDQQDRLQADLKAAATPRNRLISDCDRMIEACEAAERTLMVGQVIRHYPVSRKVKQLIADGVIGDVGHLLRRRLSNFNPSAELGGIRHWYMDPEIGGNCVLYCFGPHEYDLLHWYMDSPVVQVYAQGNESTEPYRGQKDSYTAMMNHDNGAVSVLSQSVACHKGTNDQVIIGSKGSMTFTHRQLTLNGEEVAIDEPREGMRNQIREFADCCLKGTVPDANGRSVRHTMAVIEASKQSAERGVPVQVSEFD